MSDVLDLKKYQLCEYIPNLNKYVPTIDAGKEERRLLLLARKGAAKEDWQDRAVEVLKQRV